MIYYNPLPLSQACKGNYVKKKEEKKSKGLRDTHVWLTSCMVGRLKATDAGRLRVEYNRLVEGLAQRLPGMLIKLFVDDVLLILR